MSKYMFIESRDPFDSNDVAFTYELARGLVRAGHAVALLLVQNGVLPARRGASADGLKALVEAGVRVLADEFSLRERGISNERLLAGVEPTKLDVVIDHMAEGHKTIWH